MDPNSSSKATFSKPAVAATVAKVFRRLATESAADRPYNLQMAEEIEARLPAAERSILPPGCSLTLRDKSPQGMVDFALLLAAIDRRSKRPSGTTEPEACSTSQPVGPMPDDYPTR